jgi:hypothetical protein
MNSPATGDKTPAAKRKKISTDLAIVPPSPAVNDIARALAYIRDQDAAAAAAANDQIDDDTDMADTSNEPPVEPQPVPLLRFIESLPPAFTLFAATLSKKVTSLLMAKRAKLRVVTKLEQRETILNSIRFKFELTGSAKVTGNSNFFDLIEAWGA